MKSLKKRKQILSIVGTDSTFEKATARGETVWAGKCLHCNAHLTIAADGDPISRVTVEHILPRNHGGTDESLNLGLACSRCNNQKGIRHDHKRANDPKLVALVAALSAKRKERWREPVHV